ncbi:MAG: polysaccharide pyruvyl transferase family protein [Elusimicrobiota bacterium]|nr:polysaccharide pyruvyl transferase family protein [Elusimicrobiota bacterium]
MTKKIFAAGYFGYGNFGDELILDIFTKRMRGFRVTHVKHMKTRLFSALKEIANCDAVVFPGGSVLQDESSSLSLFFYTLVIFTASLLGKPVFMLDSGFEVRRPLNKKLLRTTLKNTSFISVRDNTSFALLRSLGLKPFKSADCAFSLKPFTPEQVFPPKMIGVIPRGKNTLTEKALKLCKKNWPVAKFKFAVLNPKDLPRAEQLAGKHVPVIKSLAHAENFFGSCDFFVLAPYHSLVLAVSSGVNFTAVAYSEKVTNFLTDTRMRDSVFSGKLPEKPAADNKSRGRGMRISEEYAFQIFLNLLKDKLKL